METVNAEPNSLKDPESIPSNTETATPGADSDSDSGSEQPGGDIDEVSEGDPEKAHPETEPGARERGHRAMAWLKRWRRPIAVSILALAVACSAAFCGYAVYRHHFLNKQEALRNEYISTARAGVQRLTTIGAATVDKDVAALLAMSSGDFKTQFSSRSESYATVVKDAAVTSNGTVISIGVERMDNASATLLVASHAEVTNQGTAQPEPRDYRFRVTVSNGHPQTIAKVEFVL